MRGAKSADRAPGTDDGRVRGGLPGASWRASGRKSERSLGEPLRGSTAIETASRTSATNVSVGRHRRRKSRAPAQHQGLRELGLEQRRGPSPRCHSGETSPGSIRVELGAVVVEHGGETPIELSPASGNLVGRRRQDNRCGQTCGGAADGREGLLQAVDKRLELRFGERQDRPISHLLKLRTNWNSR